MGGGSRGYGGGGVLLSDNTWLGLGRPELLKWYISLSFLLAFFFLHVYFSPPVCNDLRLFGLVGWFWFGFSFSYSSILMLARLHYIALSCVG